MMAERPTSHEALEAVRVVIKYAESNFGPREADLLICLGRINERLVRQQRERDFTDICAQTGLHSIDRE